MVKGALFVLSSVFSDLHCFAALWVTRFLATALSNTRLSAAKALFTVAARRGTALLGELALFSGFRAFVSDEFIWSVVRDLIGARMILSPSAHSKRARSCS